MRKKYYLGIDIGSVSVKVILLDEKNQIIYHSYTRFEGQPLLVLKNELESLFEKIPPSQIESVATTGTGGKLVAQLLGGIFVNEVIAQVKATALLSPETKTIIEMGGEDSKLILLEFDHFSHNLILKDFSMNTLCAAGTGSFLDQQAKRLKISIENEFSQLALKSKNPPRIAGRCSVFAKSDMIHLQQIATPDYDIVAGLCYAMARNFKSTIAKGKNIEKPVSFQGGVAANLGMRKAFMDVFELKENEFLIPEYYAVIGAIGAALKVKEHKEDKSNFGGIKSLIQHLNSPKTPKKGKEKLTFDFPQNKYYAITKDFLPANCERINAFLGIDVGSLSTNVVVIDRDKNVLSRRYLMTEGRPIEAVRKGLEEVGNEVEGKVNILGVGTTGSGRYLIGDFVGADVVHNEITCQAIAAIQVDPKVDTIFEIGGQDSKFISLENSRVIDFEMNKVCAAGTGSFLQEQAEKLNIPIEDFGDLALSAESPVNCGERCTVFMESDLVSHQQSGTPKKDLVAGLSYSIVYNYLNKVVGDKKIGEHIFFQGGVAYNKGVVSAFEKVLGKKITVPPHFDVTGAIGAAILAMENHQGQKSSFKGFDLSKKRYNLSTFECFDCPNHCEIKKVEMEDDDPLYYGSRCEKYDVEKKRKKKSKESVGQGFSAIDGSHQKVGSLQQKELPDLFKEREKLLFSIHKEFTPQNKDQKVKKTKIGIPRILFFYELFPFWATFFENLGFEVVLSDKTNKEIIRLGCENVLAETCFPVKVGHGHIANLLSKDVDYIFVPSLINMKRENQLHSAKGGSPSGGAENYACPYVQAFPYISKAAYHFSPAKLLTIPLHFQRGRNYLLKELFLLKDSLNLSKQKIKKALNLAEKAQELFYQKIRQMGKEILDSLSEDQKALVIVGRPYNTCDFSLSLDLSKKLLDLDIISFPLDSLPLDDSAAEDMKINMYWKYGQKILASANFIREQQNLFPVYVTNFGCGPDSFIIHFFKKNLGGKPFLQLELDEHSADAGIITRCEAFLDSLKNFSAEGGKEAKPDKGIPYFHIEQKDQRTVFIPNMTDHAYALKGALKGCGIKAEVLPESDEQTLIYGRKFTSGKECYPCILTTGDLIKLLKRKDFDPEKSAFFMPTANGPCRFGQYQNFQRIILNELGFSQIPIYSPDSKNSYSNILNLDNGFQRLAWRGMVAVDLLQKLLWQTRPYEKNKGEADKVYENLLKKLEDFLIERKDLAEVLKKAKQDFKSIEQGENDKRPLVGVIGEIYIRSNRFANNNLVRKIEQLGGEAKVAPLAEWLFYTTVEYKKKSFIERRYLDLLKAHLKDKIQKKDEHKLTRLLENEFEDLYDFPVEKILNLSSLYLDKTFGTEAILSVGKSIEYIKKNYCGIINTMPFTCMPGNIVSALSNKIREDYQNIPWLNIAYEGLEDTSEIVRLEAFMYQAKQYMEKRK